MEVLVRSSNGPYPTAHLTEELVVARRTADDETRPEYRFSNLVFKVRR